MLALSVYARKHVMKFLSRLHLLRVICALFGYDGNGRLDYRIIMLTKVTKVVWLIPNYFQCSPIRNEEKIRNIDSLNLRHFVPWCIWSRFFRQIIPNNCKTLNYIFLPLLNQTLCWEIPVWTEVSELDDIPFEMFTISEDLRVLWASNYMFFDSVCKTDSIGRFHCIQ